MKEILKGFGAATFGELYADEYDERHDTGTTDAAVALLTDIADGRKTLELAIAPTVALPMLHAGIDIEGIDPPTRRTAACTFPSIEKQSSCKPAGSPR